MCRVQAVAIEETTNGDEMSDERTPQVGEIWETVVSRYNPEAAVLREGGWHWLGSGSRCVEQERRPLSLLGYTAEYVDNLRSDRRPQDVDREDAEEADRDRMIEAAARVMLGEDSWAESTPQAREDALWEAAALYDAGMLREAVTAMSERDESRAEVERLRQAVDYAVHLYRATLEERDEARAANKRGRA